MNGGVLFLNYKRKTFKTSFDKTHYKIYEFSQLFKANYTEIYIKPIISKYDVKCLSWFAIRLFVNFDFA